MNGWRFTCASALKDLRRLWRDPLGLAMCISLPFIITVLVSIVFGGVRPSQGLIDRKIRVDGYTILVFFNELVLQRDLNVREKRTSGQTENEKQRGSQLLVRRGHPVRIMGWKEIDNTFPRQRADRYFSNRKANPECTAAKVFRHFR